MNEYTQKAYIDSLAAKEKSSSLGTIQYWKGRTETAELALEGIKRSLREIVIQMRASIPNWDYHQHDERDVEAWKEKIENMIGNIGNKG